jgi:hypothetical protein
MTALCRYCYALTDCSGCEAGIAHGQAFSGAVPDFDGLDGVFKRPFQDAPVVKPTADVWTLMAICLLAIPAGVWLGWRLHGALDQRQIYRACYGLLVVTALKLLWDGVSGYLA